jgi:hypothetical protein
MRRREFISFAASGIAVAPQAAKAMPEIDEIIAELEAAIRGRLPGIKKVQVRYNPDHPEIPLSIVAFRI